MTDAAPTLFEARALHLWRGDRHLLNNISFRLGRGELLQLTGPNGVGKTSLLRACCGLLPLESGELLFEGHLVERVRDRFNAELVYLAHANALKADLTAEENLRYELSLRKGITDAALAAQLQALGIPHCAKLPARVLSAGQRRRLALARIVLSDAVFWILDEPTTNLDTQGIAVVERLMLAHLERGGAILAAAHHRLLADSGTARTLELQP